MKQIKNWDELRKVPCSKTHSLDIEDHCGWIIDIDTGDREYLSTHTFYGTSYEYSTKRLQACGFDVQISNWDAKANNT